MEVQGFRLDGYCYRGTQWLGNLFGTLMYMQALGIFEKINCEVSRVVTV